VLLNPFRNSAVHPLLIREKIRAEAMGRFGVWTPTCLLGHPLDFRKPTKHFWITPWINSSAST